MGSPRKKLRGFSCCGVVSQNDTQFALFEDGGGKILKKSCK